MLSGVRREEPAGLSGRMGEPRGGGLMEQDRTGGGVLPLFNVNFRLKYSMSHTMIRPVVSRGLRFWPFGGHRPQLLAAASRIRRSGGKASGVNRSSASRVLPC